MSSVVAATRVAASRESGTVFAASIVIGRARMSPPVAGLIGVESIERPFSMLRQRAAITMMRVKAVVDVAIEAVGTVEPWSGAE